MAGAFPYRLTGGATRPDALQFNPDFSRALTNLYYAAPPAVQRELALTSGYRSPAVQQVLWDKSDKTGHSVARPGRSKHQHGTAADLAGFGLGDGGVSQATREYVRNNAAAYGLGFPMAHEPWHIQLVGGGGNMNQTTPLGETMAEAAVSEEDLGKQQLYAGLARGVAGSSSARAQQPEVTGDVTGAPQMLNLEFNPATPAIEAPRPLTPALASLADLFKVRDIGGAAAAQPARRF